METKDTQFASKLGVLFATLGAAVGLGNIWKFPALTGENGGAAFVFLYIISCFVLALPLMIAEISLGRRGKGDIFTTFKALAPNKMWNIIAIFGLCSGGLIMAYYTDVAGWVFIYLVKSFTGSISTTDPIQGKAIFDSLISTPATSLIGQATIFVIIGGILAFGIHAGIERVTKVLLPLLTLLLIGIAIHNLFLDKTWEGLQFLFAPDFSKVTPRVLLEAVGLAFFKLSIAMGTLYTYGSYFPKNQNIPLVATRVMFADLAISLIAGIAIFPAVFTYGFEVTSGSSLLFITIPAVFASMPGGALITSIFFLLTLFATLGASIALLEVSVAVIMGRGYKRFTAICIAISILFFLGIFATLSLTPILSDVSLFGLNIFDFFDFTSSNILMPLGGFFTAIFIGWKMERSVIFNEISNQGTLFKNTYIVEAWYILVRYIVPILLLIILFNGLNLWNLIINFL